MVTAATYFGVISGYKFGTPTRLSVPRVMQAIHTNISSTLPISYHNDLEYPNWICGSIAYESNTTFMTLLSQALQFSRRSSPSPPRCSNTILRGLSGINQAFQQVGLTSPDLIGTCASFESNVVASPPVRGSNRAPYSLDPPALSQSKQLSVDAKVDG
eukprot:scaffold97367_cov88-Cyclotella_meneghiniana.AAC.3